MPTPAKSSAPAVSAPASQRVKAPALSSGPIEPAQDLTDLLRAELDHDGDAPARPAATPPPPSQADAEGDADTPADDPRAQLEGESDDDYEARLADLDAAGTGDDSTPADDPRAQLEGESDDDYEARLADLDAAADADAADDAQPKEEKVSPALQKRFGELTGKIKALEADNARLKAAATVATPARPASSFEETVQAARSESELATAQQRLEEWEEFALTHPEGFEIPGKDGRESVFYSAEQTRDLLIQTRRALRAVPKQATYIARAAEADAAALKAFPAYADPDSPVSKAYSEIVERAPALARAVPDLKLFVADALRGRALRTKAAAGPALPGRPVARPAVQPPALRGAPARGARAGDATAQARAATRAKVEESGSFDDLESAIAAKFR